MTTLPVFCGRDCGGDACPLLADIEGGRVVGIRYNPSAGRYLKGCPKGLALDHFHYSPERIKTPLKRTGPRGSGQFTPISWPEAILEIKNGLEGVLSHSGPNAIINLSSAGSTGALHTTERLTQRFLDCLGGSTRLAGNYSSNAAGYVIKKAFGDDYGSSGFDASTICASGMIVLWGSNVMEARLGGELEARLMAASKADIPIVTIDPRKTKTSLLTGARWIPIRPGTDIAFMYALLSVFDDRGAIDQEYVHARCEGFEDLLDFVRGASDGIRKTPLWAEGICGVPSSIIEGLAHEWISRNPALLLPGYSVQRTQYGEEATRLFIALQLASGSFGKRGGSTGSLSNRLPGPKLGAMPGVKGAEHVLFPILRWPDAILESGRQGSARIRAAYSAGGNYLNQGSDIAKSIRAFESLDFIVSHELFLTPTARHSDIVLPAASPLQKEDIGKPWAGNYLLYKPAILGYEGLERSDYDIFRSLADAFGKEETFSCSKSASEWIDGFLADSEISDIDAFKESGIYMGKEQDRTGLSRFDGNPRSFPLATASGKVELQGPHYIPTEQGEEGGRTFRLVTPKNGMRVHSQGGDHPGRIMTNSLQINDVDASAIGVSMNDLVTVTSAQGSVHVRCVPTDRIASGVVSLDEGTWFSRDSMEKSGSANFLTSTAGTAESISCIMHGIPVSVEKD